MRGQLSYKRLCMSKFGGRQGGLGAKFHTEGGGGRLEVSIGMTTVKWPLV